MIDDALFAWLRTNVEVEESKVWHCNEAPLFPDCFASLAMTGKEKEIGAIIYQAALLLLSFRCVALLYVRQFYSTIFIFFYTFKPCKVSIVKNSIPIINSLKSFSFLSISVSVP